MIKDILSKTQGIIDGTLPYQVFLKELASNVNYQDDEKQLLRQLVNGLLNRYYRYFYSLTAAQESDLTIEEVLALALYSVNLEKKYTTLSYEEVLSALSASSQVKIEERYPQTSFPILIPTSFHSEDLELSYAARFSTPLFLIDTLIADIGKKNILRYLTTRPQENTGMVNIKLSNPETFFMNQKHFRVGSLPQHFVYDGRDYIKKTSVYLNNEIIIASQSLLDIATMIGEANVSSLLLIQHEDSSLLLLLALTYPDMQIDFFAEENKARFIVQHLIKKFDLTNVNYITNISKTYDFVLTTLSSSNINGNVRHRDFFFRLNKDLQSYASKGARELLGVKDYVANDGKLLFLTSTALRAETHYQALSLIRDYPEFTLVREKQQYHFNKHHETVYYALFARGTHGA